MKSIKFTNKQKNIIDFAEYELENNKKRCFQKSARYQDRDNKYFEGYYLAYYEKLNCYQTQLLLMLDKSNELKDDMRDKYIEQRLLEIKEDYFPSQYLEDKEINCRARKGRDYRVGYERGFFNSVKYIRRNIDYFIKLQ